MYLHAGSTETHHAAEEKKREKNEKKTRLNKKCPILIFLTKTKELNKKKNKICINTN